MSVRKPGLVFRAMTEVGAHGLAQRVTVIAQELDRLFESLDSDLRRMRTIANASRLLFLELLSHFLPSNSSSTAVPGPLQRNEN